MILSITSVYNNLSSGKVARKLFLFVLLSIFMFSQKTARSQTVDTNFVDGWIYVKVFDTSLVELAPYNFGNISLNALYTSYTIDTITKPFSGINAKLDKTYRIQFSQITQIDSLITALQSLYYIEYAEKAPLYRTSFIPNDLQPSQWALTKINATQGWDISTGSMNIKIAIIDNAVSTTHTDLSGNIWVNSDETPNNFLDDDLNGFADDINGWDVADGDNNPNPPSGANTSSAFIHGTHCAGIASAKTNNGMGIASVGFNVTIIGVKCSKDNSSDQGQSLPYAYDGLSYAIKAKADIVSMSWGGSSGIFLTGEGLINAANALGIVLVAAAGNNNSTTPFYPASYNYVISVGATDQGDQKASFSNYGSTIDVMAPGVSIYSTISGGNNAYAYLSGTSMACPMVAGLAGLVLSANPSLAPSAVQTAIKNGCENIDALNPLYVGMMGAGRINAYNSLLPVSNDEIIVNERDFVVFPNPNNGKFIVATGNTINKYTISLYDIQGREVFSEEVVFIDGKKQFDRHGLTAGFYFIKVSNEHSSSLKKIVIQ